MMLWSWLCGVLSVSMLIFTHTYCQNHHNGDVRLVGGSYQWEGRVEVYMSGVWGTVTDSDWTDEDATAVCRVLGHFRPDATAHSGAYFGEGGGAVNLDSVHCTGSEYILTDCQLDNSGRGTSHSLDVGVKCQPAEGSFREGDIRLVGGPTNWEGRVEIFLNGTWGTISDSQWTVSDARVVCRQLQHAAGSGVAVGCCDIHGEGIGAVHIHNLACSGTEENITTCTYFNTTESLSHEHDVGVQCQQGDKVRDGEIRLNRTYGTRSWEGRVEIFLSGEWGTVCDDGASSVDATVVCRQLGYYARDSLSCIMYTQTAGSTSNCCAQFGRGTGLIHFAYPSCTGSEYRLNDCVNRPASCGHYEDWGVRCRTDGPEPLDVSLSSTNKGYAQVFLNRSWVPIADSNMIWKVQNSEVLCRQLGYDLKGLEVTHSNYSYPTSLKQMDNVNCTGTEAELKDCSYDIHIIDVHTTFKTACGYYNCSTGDIRLVGGESEREGRVELCNNKTWGTVCGRQWTYRHTAVVCRFIGFSDLLIDVALYSFKRFGKGTGPVFMDYVECTGDEWNFWGGCTHFTHYHGCSHNDDIEVQCKPARCSDEQIRLADTLETTERVVTEIRGRVEICSDQRWERLTDVYRRSYRLYTNAMVVCNELGYQFSLGRYYTLYGERSGSKRHSEYFRCTGEEDRLSDCQSYNISTQNVYDVRVYCRAADCYNGQIRLVEGKDQYEGRLEVCYNGRWGTVGADEWTETNSRVVCNSLGYDYSDDITNLSIPMAPSKPLYYHRVQCSSQDLSLVECGFMRYTDLTKTYPNTVIKCKEPVCEDGDLRLVGGATESEGGLEVCFGKRWGTIDGHGWTHTDTQVACRQLGHSTEDTEYERTEQFATHSLPVFITLAACYGTEWKLNDCSYHEFDSTTTSSIDISINCVSSTDSEGYDDKDKNDSKTGDSPTGASQTSSTFYASLSISALLSLVVVTLAAVIIVLFVLRRRKMRSESSFRVHFNCKNEIVCLDNRCYEKVEAFPNQSSPKKTQTTHSTRCDASKPAAALPQIHFHVGQQRQQREILNLEPVYECPQ